jgi:hypothetical protein
MEKKVKYITYQINGSHGNNTPVAVDCKDLTNEQTTSILLDTDSLFGISNVRVNRTGKVRKDIMIISMEEHYQYNWDKISKNYYNKCFNPSNF